MAVVTALFFGQWAARPLARKTLSLRLTGSVGTILFHLGSGTGDAFARPKHARFRHLGAGYFLDLARGTRSVVYPDALPEFQVDDILFSRKDCCFCCGGKRKQSKNGKSKRSRRGQDAATRNREHGATFGHRIFPVAAEVFAQSLLRRRRFSNRYVE
jgi:hypothetical protein